MAAKRLTRKLTDVIAEVEKQLIAHYNVTEAQIESWRLRAQALLHRFPVSSMIEIEDLWIDYEVQRDVIHKHILGPFLTEQNLRMIPSSPYSWLPYQLACLVVFIVIYDSFGWSIGPKNKPTVWT